MLEKIVRIARNLSKKQTNKQNRLHVRHVDSVRELRWYRVSESWKVDCTTRNSNATRVQWQEQLPGASSEEGRETEGAEVHGSTNNISYKRLFAKLGGWAASPRHTYLSSVLIESWTYRNKTL